MRELAPINAIKAYGCTWTIWEVHLNYALCFTNIAPESHDILTQPTENIRYTNVQHKNALKREWNIILSKSSKIVQEQCTTNAN